MKRGDIFLKIGTERIFLETVDNVTPDYNLNTYIDELSVFGNVLLKRILVHGQLEMIIYDDKDIVRI